jgi:hypothetical protein
MLPESTGCVYKNTRCTSTLHSFYSILSARIHFQEFFPQLYDMSDFTWGTYHTVFFCRIPKERGYYREKYRRRNIQVFFGGWTPVFSGIFFRVPCISCEQLEIVHWKFQE